MRTKKGHRKTCSCWDCIKTPSPSSKKKSKTRSKTPSSSIRRYGPWAQRENAWKRMKKTRSKSRTRSKSKTRSKNKIPLRPELKRSKSGKTIWHKTWLQAKECRYLEKCKNRYRAALIKQKFPHVKLMMDQYKTNLDTSDQECKDLLERCKKEMKFRKGLKNIPVGKLSSPIDWITKEERKRRKSRRTTGRRTKKSRKKVRFVKGGRRKKRRRRTRRGGVVCDICGGGHETLNCAIGRRGRAHVAVAKAKDGYSRVMAKIEAGRVRKSAQRLKGARPTLKRISQNSQNSN
jgi:hypothetical protein